MLKIIFLLAAGFVLGWSVANMHFVHHAQRPPKVEEMGQVSEDQNPIGDDGSDPVVERE